MALNPAFASASVNPSQTVGNDASAPQQGALPTGAPATQNTGSTGLGQQPQGNMPPQSYGVSSPFIIQSPTPNYNFDVSYPSINYGAMQQPPQQDTYGFDATGNYVGANMPTGGFNPFGNRIDTPMQPDYMGQPATQEFPDYKYVDPNPRINYFNDKNNFGGDLNTQIKAIDDAGQADPQYTEYLKKFYADADSYRNAPFTGEFRDMMPSPPQDYVSYLGQQDLINKQNSMPYQSQDNLFGQQGSSQGAMFRQEPTDPNYVQRNYTAQDVQTAMKNPEFDSNYYKNANVLDAQGNPLSMDAKQQLIQPFYNQVEQSMQYGPQIPYQDPQGLIGPSLSPIGLPQFTSPQQTTPPPPPAMPSPPPQATPTGTPPMATNPLSQVPVAQTAAFTPAPVVGTPSSGGGSFTQGAPLPNITTTQQQVTAAPAFYTDYLNQLAKQGASTAQNAQYVGATDLQNQAFNQTAQNVGNYQPALQSAINMAQNVGDSNLYKAVGELGQANIARNLAPQATAGIVGSGQFGSKRGAAALGDTIANAQLGITAQQATALQQDMQNRIAAAQQLGNLATTTQQLGLGDINALATMGGQKQTIAQNEQLFPMQQLTNQSQLLRGYTIPTSTGSSYTGPIPGAYSASPLQQIAGLGALGAGISQTKLGDAIGRGLSGSGDAAMTALSKLFNISGTGTPSTNETNLPPIRTPDGVTATPNGDGSYTTSDGRIVGVDGNPIPGYVYPNPGGNDEMPFPGNFDYNDTTLPIPTDETYNSWFGD
jgi:hypothetical protein